MRGRNKAGAWGVYTVTTSPWRMKKPMAMRGLRRMCAVVAVVAAGAALGQETHPEGKGSFAQAPPQTATATIHVQAQLVVLDVVVTDRKGNLVTRPLERGDFTIYENGVEQRIASFEGPETHRMPGSGAGGAAVAVVHSAADLSRIGNAPVTVLVLDELNSAFADMSFSRQMLVKYLEAQPKVLREPTVLMVAKNTSFEQMHDYTQDRDALVEAVKKHMPENPWRLNNSGKAGPGAVERMAQVMAALGQIAQASEGTPGRKNLIWVGNGFPSADLTGLPNNQADTIVAAMRRVTAELLAARVTMYTINPIATSSDTVELDDPSDLATSMNSGGGDPFGTGQVSFTNLAPSTGGIAFTGRNDLNNVIGEGIAKGQEYYTMSYAPTDRTQDTAKFRTIKIVMKDKDLRATTRDGYYPETAATLNPVVDKGMSAAQVKANLQLDLSNALLTTISYNGLRVTAEKNGGGYVIHVAEQGIGWSEEGANGAVHEEATLAAGWYDAKGKLLGHVAREQLSQRGGPDAGARFELPVELPRGVARLRIVVRDAINGHMGTVDLKMQGAGSREQGAGSRE
jgi:VWFA-related protein